MEPIYRKPLDKRRTKEMNRLKSELPSGEYAKLNDMMLILRKHHECLTKEDKQKLALLYKYSPILKKAHKLAIRLTHIFNTHHSRKHANTKINRLIKRIERSDINMFNGFIETLNKYRPQILNYFKKRKNSGFVEGLNNKIKVMKRRCYGLGSPTSYFQRIWLDLNGFDKFAI
ncbi:transposase [Francisella philomiragia]|uniref:transposase n=1 Tax=Francisella philomiragia TaxID=28110 RepID=UPI003517CA2A